jgi:hypothetical protein
MELEKRIAKLERLPFRIVVVGGSILAALAILTIEVFGYSKLLKYLWVSF